MTVTVICVEFNPVAPVGVTVMIACVEPPPTGALLQTNVACVLMLVLVLAFSYAPDEP